MNDADYCIICGERKVYSTLAEASEAREVAGEFIVYEGTFDIVKDPSWFWVWERRRPSKSYAAERMGLA